MDAVCGESALGVARGVEPSGGREKEEEEV